MSRLVVRQKQAVHPVLKLKTGKVVKQTLISVLMARIKYNLKYGKIISSCNRNDLVNLLNISNINFIQLFFQFW